MREETTHGAGQPCSWMSNLDGAGGTRTHDPRIMSLHFDIMPRACLCCFMLFRPVLPWRRIRAVPVWARGVVLLLEFMPAALPPVAAAKSADYFRQAGCVPPTRRVRGRAEGLIKTVSARPPAADGVSFRELACEAGPHTSFTVGTAVASRPVGEVWS
jgi:hypothetical protein